MWLTAGTGCIRLDHKFPAQRSASLPHLSLHPPHLTPPSLFFSPPYVPLVCFHLSLQCSVQGCRAGVWLYRSAELQRVKCSSGQSRSAWLNKPLSWTWSCGCVCAAARSVQRNEVRCEVCHGSITQGFPPHTHNHQSHGLRVRASLHLNWTDPSWPDAPSFSVSLCVKSDLCAALAGVCRTVRWFIRNAKSMQKQSLLHPFPACQPGSCWLFIKGPVRHGAGTEQVRRMCLDGVIDWLLPCRDSSWMD